MELFFKTLLIWCKDYQLLPFGAILLLVKIQFDYNKNFSVREKEVDGKLELHKLRSLHNEERSKKAEEKSYEALDGLKSMESDVSCIKKDVADIRIKLDEKFERVVDGKEKKMFKEESCTEEKISTEEKSSTEEDCKENKQSSERTANHWNL